MPLTVADFQGEMLQRAGTLMNWVCINVETAGFALDLNGPLREALSSLDLCPADFVVVDADLAGIDCADWPQLFDVAELRLLRNIMGNLIDVDVSVAYSSKQALGQIGVRLNQRIEDQDRKCRQQYSYGLGSLVGGSIDLGWGERLNSTGLPT